MVFKVLARATKVFDPETRQTTITFFPAHKVELDITGAELASLKQPGMFTVHCRSGPLKGRTLDLMDCPLLHPLPWNRR